MLIRALSTLFVSIVCMLPSVTLAADGDIVTQLPAPAEDIAVAESGQTLVLKLKGQKGLTIYDTRTQMLRTLELPTDDFSFGAGGDMIVVFLKETNEIQSYNVKSLKLVKGKEFADPINIMTVIMGHSRSNLAFVRIARGSDSLSNTSNHLLDVTTLTLIKPKSQQSVIGRNSSFRDMAHYRANGDMSRLTEWATSHSPTGIYLYTRTEDGYRNQGNHDSAGYLAISDNGRIYTGFGNVMDLVPKVEGSFGDPIGIVGRVPQSSLFPGIGGMFFLGMKADSTLSVYQTGDTKALCPLEPFPGWTPPPRLDGIARQPEELNQLPGLLEEWARGPLTLDKRIVFAPAANLLVFLPSSNDRLVQRNFDLESLLKKTGKDYLLVLSNPALHTKAGTKWNYQVATLSKYGPVKFQLEKHPEGMTISAEGNLNWKVPAGVQGKAPVVIAITDEKSHVIRHNFIIDFE